MHSDPISEEDRRECSSTFFNRSRRPGRDHRRRVCEFATRLLPAPTAAARAGLLSGAGPLRASDAGGPAASRSACSGDVVFCTAAELQRAGAVSRLTVSSGVDQLAQHA